MRAWSVWLILMNSRMLNVRELMCGGGCEGNSWNDRRLWFCLR